MRSMRIAIANAGICLSRGGAERTAIRLAGAMRALGHEVILLTVRGNDLPVYPVNSGINVFKVSPGLLAGDKNCVENTRKILLENGIEILVSLESDWKHLCWRKSCGSAGIAFVCSERDSPYLIEKEFWNRQARLEFLAYCDAIHEVLPCYLPCVPKELRKRAFVIPNAAPDNTPSEFIPHDSAQKTILFLGRFTRKKRPQMLLEAFSLLATDFSEWRLRFAGWGEEEGVLRQRAEELNLGNRVEIRKANEDVSLEYKKASIYCLPTRFEGFPNTVLEAMGEGLPVVGISDCQAIESILIPGKTGIMASHPDPSSLAAAMRSLMASDNARRRIGQNAWNECKNNYSPKRIFTEWERKLKEVLAKQ